MTNAEIVAEYRQAAAPLKQISILADENMCARSDIVEILREAGCELPKIYLPKKKTPEAEIKAEAQKEAAAEGKTEAPAEPETEAVTEAEKNAETEPESAAAAEVKTEAPADAALQRLEDLMHTADELAEMIVRSAAVDAIAKLLAKLDAEDPDGTYDFREQVRGVLSLVREIELR